VYGAPGITSGGGSTLVVWEDDPRGHYDVFGARVAIDGTPLDPLGGVALSTKAGDEHFPRTAWTGDRYLVVWDIWPSGASIGGSFGTYVSTAPALTPSGDFTLTASGAGAALAAQAGAALAAYSTRGGIRARFITTGAVGPDAAVPDSTAPDSAAPDGAFDAGSADVSTASPDVGSVDALAAGAPDAGAPGDAAEHPGLRSSGCGCGVADRHGGSARPSWLALLAIAILLRTVNLRSRRTSRP
jgi:hypothetical protein